MRFEEQRVVKIMRHVPNMPSLMDSLNLWSCQTLPWRAASEVNTPRFGSLPALGDASWRGVIHSRRDEWCWERRVSPS